MINAVFWPLGSLHDLGVTAVPFAQCVYMCFLQIDKYFHVIMYWTFSMCLQSFQRPLCC